MGEAIEDTEREREQNSKDPHNAWYFTEQLVYLGESVILSLLACELDSLVLMWPVNHLKLRQVE